MNNKRTESVLAMCASDKNNKFIDKKNKIVKEIFLS